MIENSSKGSSKRLLSEFSFKFLIVSALFIGSIFVFGFLAHEFVYENEDFFDQQVFTFLASHIHEPILRFMRVATFFGSVQFLLPAYLLIVVFLFIKKNRKLAIHIAVLAFSSTILIFGLKLVFRRQRPSLPLISSFQTYSFPSGHALGAFIFSCVLIYMVWQSRWKIAVKWLLAVGILLFALLIGVSRIVLKLHYASDVVAGFCMGFAWVLLSFYILDRPKGRKSGKQLS